MKNFIFLIIAIFFLSVIPTTRVQACHLTINKIGDGTGVVTGAGSYSVGNIVNPTATPDTSSTFGGWSGDCTGSSQTTSVTIVNPAETLCKATFNLKTFILTVGKTGTGDGTVSGSGTFNYGTTQTATATPNAGSTFDGWSGDCSVSGSVLMDAAKTCTATFSLIPAISYTVISSKVGSGTITPASQSATSGSNVIFTVTPDSGYTATIGGTCLAGSLVGTTYTTGSITGDCEVIATFTAVPKDSYVLIINTLGTGTGVVTGAGTYSSGTVVTAIATPNTDSTFTVWSDNCPGGVVTMTSNITCTATFILKPVLGCLDNSATNYNSLATQNDGSCIYTQTHHYTSSGSIPFPVVISAPVGQVLGAETTCGIYVDKFVRRGYNNDVETVKKIQNFLNDYMSSGLTVDGIYGLKTEQAVKNFQVKHADKVLEPWGLKAPTGIFYLTTQTEVNNIMCPVLNLPIPELVPLSQNSSLFNKGLVKGVSTFTNIKFPKTGISNELMNNETVNVVSPTITEETPAMSFRLSIPKINVDASLESVKVQKNGAMGVPVNIKNVGWLNQSSIPGEIGTSVIDGHSGWKNKTPVVFDNLILLKKGDNIYIKDDKGKIDTFVVQNIKRYPVTTENTQEVFFSNDGESHLNLITCTGTWNKKLGTHSQRLVVFADKVK